MNPDGTDVQRLTFHAATDAAPEWSPDGKRIAFQSNRDGNDDIWVMNADGSGLVQLTDNAVRDAEALLVARRQADRLPPDVEYLGEVHGELFTMNADGSDVGMLSVPSFEGSTGSRAGARATSRPLAAARLTVPLAAPHVGADVGRRRLSLLAREATTVSGTPAPRGVAGVGARRGGADGAGSGRGPPRGVRGRRPRCARPAAAARLRRAAADRAPGAAARARATTH